MADATTKKLLQLLATDQPAEVRGAAAILEGPDGVWTVTRGDTVPGVGRIDSIVRWGNRWIVATAGGLIATP